MFTKIPRTALYFHLLYVAFSHLFAGIPQNYLAFKAFMTCVEKLLSFGYFKRAATYSMMYIRVALTALESL